MKEVYADLEDSEPTHWHCNDCEEKMKIDTNYGCEECDHINAVRDEEVDHLTYQNNILHAQISEEKKKTEEEKKKLEAEKKKLKKEREEF